MTVKFVKKKHSFMLKRMKPGTAILITDPEVIRKLRKTVHYWRKVAKRPLRIAVRRVEDGIELRREE